MPSATVHDDFVALATELINEHGRNAVLVSIADSGTEWNPTQVETTTDVVIVQTQFSANEVDGELVKSSDLRFLMDSAVEPLEDMRLRDDSFDYSIKGVTTVKPGTTTILYKVQARL